MAYVDHKVGARDLRLKLRRKNIRQTSQSGPLSGVRDLREKLSGLTNTQLVNTDPSKPKLETFRSSRKSVAVETPEAKKATNPAKKKAPQKA